MDDLINVTAAINGRVQGVFFRANTKRNADRIGINGWVKNMPDGSVSAFLQGTEQQVEEMIRWCRKGTPPAVVSSVETYRTDTSEIFTDFSIRY